jgi:hypothetical protein
MQMGKAAIAIKMPNPRSCRAFLISPTVIASFLFSTTTTARKSEVGRSLIVMASFLVIIAIGVLSG